MKRIDPFFYFLRYIVLSRFFSVELKAGELEFVDENITKHRMVLWVNVIAAVLTIIGFSFYEIDDLGTVVTGLLGPVMVLGGAWFAISFGGIPEKLLDVAMSITFWMFSAFTVSLTTMSITIAFITPGIFWPTLIFVHIGTILACINYDTADGLKAGLDEALLQHSRAHIAWLAKNAKLPQAMPADEA